MIVIREIEKGSLGERSGFKLGDKITRINGLEVNDPIDFQVHSGEQLVNLEIERNGEFYDVEIEREIGESFGLDFEDIKLRSCNNKCVFCFIHQMPRGMRRSLYFEDDDYRLSFLHGSYVTLTNVKEKDIDRIIEQRLSPQYISVHATDPELRQRVLGRRKATVDILERIAKLADNGIEMHTQVVVCPGLNDGVHLERTVRGLRAFSPQIRSVALVPVGLTRFRQKLPELRPVTTEDAREYVVFADRMGETYVEEIGERFVYAADELFLKIGRPVPERAYYDAFPQIENGIGMVRSFLDTWARGRARLPRVVSPPLHLGLITGKLACLFLGEIVADLNRIEGLEVELLVVENETFGAGITVSGLLAGEDILRKIRGRGDLDRVMLPPNCINGEGLTLDDMTVPQLEEQSGISVQVGQYDLAASVLVAVAGGETAVTGSGRLLSELGYYVGRTG